MHVADEMHGAKGWRSQSRTQGQEHSGTQTSYRNEVATLAKNGHGQSVRYQIRIQDQEAKWEHELRSGPTEQCSIESGCKSRVQNQSEVFISQAKKVQGSRQQSE